MKKILKYLLPAIFATLVITIAAHAQVVSPQYFRKVGNNIYPIAGTSTIIGSTSYSGAVNNLTIAGSCSGCGGGASTSINGVSGPTFTFGIVGTSSASSITTSSGNLFLNLMLYTSSSDITVSPTGTIVFANHNVSQFPNDAGYVANGTGTSPLFNNINASGTINASTSITINGVRVSTTSPTFANPTASVGTSAVNGVSTSSMRSDAAPPINQAGTYSFSALGNTTSTGNITAGSLSISGSTYLNGTLFCVNVNGYHCLPSAAQLAAGATCGNSSGVTDPETCLADYYTADAGVVSTTAVQFQPGSYSTANQFLAGTSGHYISFQGITGNGTIWNFTAATGTAFTIDDCVSNSKYQALQMRGLTIQGSTATTTNGGTTGILAGKTNGACATKVEDMNIGNFTYDLITATGTYWFTGANLNLYNAQRCLWQQTAGNAGENMEWDNIKCSNPATLAMGGIASTSQEILLDTNSSPDTHFVSPSFDEAEYYQNPGNYVTMSAPYSEDSQASIGGMPDRFYVSTTAAFSTLTVNGGDSWEDQTSTASGGPIPTIFNCGSVCSISGMAANRQGSATTTQNFITNAAGPTTAWENVKNITNGTSNSAFTTLINGFISTPNNGEDVTSIDNSWPMGYVITGTNQIQFQDGGSTQMYVSPGGIGFQGGFPTVSCAAGGSSVVAHSDNNGGSINNTSSTQSCTVTFASSGFTNPPTCVAEVSSGTNQSYITTSTATAFTFTAAASMATGSITNYVCIGH
jgi:hypothetical protein